MPKKIKKSYFIKQEVQRCTNNNTVFMNQVVDLPLSFRIRFAWDVIKAINPITGKRVCHPLTGKRI